jgi:hypothetical protein
MPLTNAQQAALKADIAANNSQLTIGTAPPTAIKDLPNTGDINVEIANWYNGVASPDFNVFRSSVSMDDVYDQVVWANFTPQDVPDATALWTNRSLACQGKQFNVQIMLQGRTSFNATKINQRAGLNDATTNIPSGAAGASKSGGWAGILGILRRLANRIEKLFAIQTSGVGVTGGDALGATTNPALMAFEGFITGNDVTAARNS